jgi:hypothetical protein
LVIFLPENFITKKSKNSGQIPFRGQGVSVGKASPHPLVPYRGTYRAGLFVWQNYYLKTLLLKIVKTSG